MGWKTSNRGLELWPYGGLGKPFHKMTPFPLSYDGLTISLVNNPIIIIIMKSHVRHTID